MRNPADKQTKRKITSVELIMEMIRKAKPPDAGISDALESVCPCVFVWLLQSEYSNKQVVVLLQQKRTAA